MNAKINNLLNRKYPQNYVIRKPYIGTVIIFVTNFIFLMLYKPFGVHPARTFSLEFTMAAYCLSIVIPVFVLAKSIKHFKYFSNANDWTIVKEILSVLLILISMGIFIYLSGFVMEAPADRWNLSTFSSSMFYGILIGLVPFSFFTLINYRYLNTTEVIENFTPTSNAFKGVQPESLILIPSQLKKEEVSFYPQELLYAESDGNYVVFYLMINGQIQKRMVRNSMNNIEKHLSEISYLKRIHRAFIVNLKYIKSVKGNTLGYRVKLTGVDNEIPVSRQNAVDFIQIVKQYQ